MSEDALRKSSFQPVTHFGNYSSLIQPVAEIAFNELKCHFGHRKYFKRVSHVAHERDEQWNSFVHQSLQFPETPARKTFQAIITNDDYTTFELWIHKKSVERGKSRHKSSECTQFHWRSWVKKYTVRQLLGSSRHDMAVAKVFRFCCSHAWLHNVAISFLHLFMRCLLSHEGKKKDRLRSRGGHMVDAIIDNLLSPDSAV